MRTRKCGFMSPLISPYKFVMVGSAFSNRYSRFHSETFSINLVPRMNRAAWLEQEELGIAKGEDNINGFSWDFSQKGNINNEFH